MDIDQLLDEVRTEVGPPSTQDPPAGPPKGAIQKINYSHDGMINLILANRGITQNRIAQHFGYSASWVSMVMCSDAFKARLAERAAEIEDPALRATIEDDLKGMAKRSLEILKEKLNEDACNVPDNLALRALEMSTRALGMGTANQQQPPAQVNVNLHLENLGGRLVDLLTRKKAEINPPLDHLSLPSS